MSIRPKKEKKIKPAPDHSFSWNEMIQKMQGLDSEDNHQKEAEKEISEASINSAFETCICNVLGFPEEKNWKFHNQYCPIWKNGRIAELEIKNNNLVPVSNGWNIVWNKYKDHPRLKSIASEVDFFTKDINAVIERFEKGLNNLNAAFRQILKKESNHYYVCNHDEPYAQDVLKVILEGESKKMAHKIVVKPWKSKAKWKKDNKYHETEDSHNEKDQAETVCRMLLSDYSSDSPCPIRGVCIDAWIVRNEE